MDYQKEITEHLKVLETLKADSGLFTAAPKDVATGYNKAWLRDVFFITLAYQETGDWQTVRNAAKALLQILCKHRQKIDWATHNKPLESWQYIHARYNPETFEEYWEEWGNKQNDAVGEVLHLITMCELNDAPVVESDEERQMVQLLVEYLNNIEYWHDADSGIWEEYAEVHASSLGSCVAGLTQAAKLEYVTLPKGVLENGREALANLLPRESKTKSVDLALLSLIYPFAVTTEAETALILERMEAQNVRERGVIRYSGDEYYNRKDEMGVAVEAEWTMGLSWIAIIYANLGQKEQAERYLAQAHAAVTAEGLLPELYYGGTDRPNENTPLGWSESMYIVANQKVAALLSNS